MKLPECIPRHFNGSIHQECFHERKWICRRKKQGFTLEAHKELGPELDDMVTRTMKIGQAVMSAYPKSRARAVIEGVDNAILGLKQMLEDLLAEDRPELKNIEIHSIYHRTH